MRFAHPAWLALIWAAPVALALFAWGQHRRSRALRAFAGRETLPRIAGETTAGRRWLAAGLLAAALLFAAIALAGPRYGFHWRTSERRGVDLIVALDCSRSMLAEDVKPSRLAQAKREVLDLVGRLQGDRVGLVAFAGTAFLQCPLTLDYDGLNLFLQALGPDYLPVGGTALADALDTARESFDPKSPADRAIVLITDGGETTGAARKAAERLRGTGIRVFALGVGTPEGAPIPAADGGFVEDPGGSIVLARLGADALQNLASSTGGAYARSVPGDKDLEALLKAMGSDLTARTLETRRVKVWEDRYQWPLALALASLLAELCLPLGRRSLTAVFLVLFAAGGARAESAGALTREGLEHYRAGDYAAAREALTRAQVEAPEAPEIAFDLGNAYYRAGDYENAVKSFSEALRNAPPDLKTQALYNRGNAAYRLGKLPEAVADYEAALKSAPEDRDARLNLEFVRRKMEEQKKSQQRDSRDSGKTKPSDQEQPSGKESLPKNAGQEPKEGQGNPAKPGAAGRDTTPPSTPSPETAGAKPNKAGGKSGERGTPPEAAAAGEGAQARRPQDAGRERGEEKPAEAAQAAARARALLNRLKDEPGKAAVPAYGERRVEKDW